MPQRKISLGPAPSGKTADTLLGIQQLALGERQRKDKAKADKFANIMSIAEVGIGTLDKVGRYFQSNDALAQNRQKLENAERQLKATIGAPGQEEAHYKLEQELKREEIEYKRAVTAAREADLGLGGKGAKKVRQSAASRGKSDLNAARRSTEVLRADGQISDAVYEKSKAALLKVDKQIDSGELVTATDVDEAVKNAIDNSISEKITQALNAGVKIEQRAKHLLSERDAGRLKLPGGRDLGTSAVGIPVTREQMRAEGVTPIDRVTALAIGKLTFQDDPKALDAWLDEITRGMTLKEAQEFFSVKAPDIEFETPTGAYEQSKLRGGTPAGGRNRPATASQFAGQAYGPGTEPVGVKEVSSNIEDPATMTAYNQAVIQAAAQRQLVDSLLRDSGFLGDADAMYSDPVGYGIARQRTGRDQGFSGNSYYEGRDVISSQLPLGAMGQELLGEPWQLRSGRFTEGAMTNLPALQRIPYQDTYPTSPGNPFSNSRSWRTERGRSITSADRPLANFGTLGDLSPAGSPEGAAQMAEARPDIMRNALKILIDAQNEQE